MPQAAIAALAKVFIYYGVQAAVAKFAATIFVYAASAYLLNRAAKSMTPKSRSQGALSSVDVNYYNSGAPIRFAYGRVRTGGMETIPPLVGGTNNKLLHKVLTLVGHEVDSFNAAYFDALLIPNSYIRAMAYTSSDGEVLSGTYSGHAFIRRYRGTATDSGDKLLNDYSPTIFGAFRGRSFAKAMVSLVYNQEIYKQVPDITFLYQAKRCYDPRLDVSPGANTTNTAYHRWGTSGGGIPAIALTDYLMSDYGGSYDADDIDWDTVVTAANNCDTIVPRPISWNTYAISANMSQSGLTFTKTSGGDAWGNAAFRSTDSHNGANRVVVTFKANQVNADLMVGLNSNPTLDDSYTSLDRAFYCRADGIIAIYEDNVAVGSYGTYTTETIFKIVFSDASVDYYVDGVLVRGNIFTFTGAKFVDSSVFTQGASVTLGVGKRYSCNGVLQATDKFEENVKAIANSMLGKIIFRDGKWRIYAGGWKTPDFTIQKSDWISSVSVKFEQGKGKRFNRMRGWFVDPDRDWQREECFPRSNATYLTADKGERIDAEFEDLLCTDEDETQQKAELLLRQSRNQITITGRLPPRFQDIATWDTGTIVMPGFGWTSKTFRAVSLDLNPDGTVDGVFQEEQSEDWDDMEGSEYDKPSLIPLPITNVTTPSAPPNFTVARQINGTILFDWGTPVVFPAGSRFQIIRSTTTLAVVTTAIWQGDANPVPLVCPTSPHWYFARAITPQGVVSDYTPNTFGLGVSARLEADQTLQFRVIGDAEFEYTMASSLWKSDIFYASNTLPGGNTLIGGTVSDPGTVVYNNTGGQYGGYVKPYKYSTANNSPLYLMIYRAYNESQPDGVAYNGRPFGFTINARFRINSLHSFTDQFTFMLIAKFSTPNTPVFYSRLATINVRSGDVTGLGAWSEYFKQDAVTFPLEPVGGAEITSAYGHTLIAAIGVVGTTNFDVDYFQVTNLGHVNYPLSQKLVAGPSGLVEEDSMKTQTLVNCFGSGHFSFNVANPRQDWRRWQIGRIIECVKPQRVQPFYIIPGSLNPPNIILSGRTAIGTVTLNSADYSYATIEKVSETDIFVSGGGLT